MDVYVMKDGRREGPYQPFRLREMLEEGNLTPLDSVWHEGMENWQALGETESLRGVLRREPVEPAVPETPTATAPVPKFREEGELTLAVVRARRAMAWRRFFARQMDLHISIALVIPALAALNLTDIWSVLIPNPWYLAVAPAAVWIGIETVMLALLGWTPGRFLLGLRVLRRDGGQVTFLQALQRSALVWVGGIGFGLQPGYLLPVAQWMYGWWSLQKRGITLWDHSAGTTVQATLLNRWHVTGIALLLAVFTALNIWLMLSAPLPDRISEKDRASIEELRSEFWKSE
jgi:uncharacterized RDD family membrane protein YckC